MATTRPTARAAGDRHPTALYTFGTCLGGYALNAMDVLIFNPVMREQLPFRVTNADVVLIGTATLLSSAFGGWLAGALSDRFGRVQILRCMIAWLAVFTCLCGFAQNYVELFTWRTLMGVGFGGQWAAAAVMVGEAFSKAHRGKAVGFMQSGWALGWFVAELMPKLPHHLTLPPNVAAWQVLFWASALLALPILCVSLFVEESPVFEETRKNLARAGRKADSLEIFSPKMLWITFLTCMLSIGTMGGYYAIMVWLPNFLTQPKLTVAGIDGYLAILIAGSFVGYLVSAWLSDLDLIKRRWNFVWFAIGAIVTVFAHIYIGFAHHIPADKTYETIILVLEFWLGFFASGAFAGSGAFFTELFPTRMRGSGVGFSYNFGRGFAALILWLVGAGLLQRLLTSLLQGASAGVLPDAKDAAGWLGLSIGVSVLIAYGLVAIAALLLCETKGTVLDTKSR